MNVILYFKICEHNVYNENWKVIINLKTEIYKEIIRNIDLPLIMLNCVALKLHVTALHYLRKSFVLISFEIKPFLFFWPFQIVIGQKTTANFLEAEM